MQSDRQLQEVFAKRFSDLPFVDQDGQLLRKGNGSPAICGSGISQAVNDVVHPAVYRLQAWFEQQSSPNRRLWIAWSSIAPAFCLVDQIIAVYATDRSASTGDEPWSRDRNTR